MNAEELQSALVIEREARIRAEGERDGFAKALAIFAQNSGRDVAAERRRAKDREAKAARKAATLTIPQNSSERDPSPPLDGSPLPSVPSFPSPLSSPLPTFPTASAIGGESESLPAATDDAVSLDGDEPKRETLVLTATTAGRKEPKPSPAQKLYAALEASRAEMCEKVGLGFIAQGWDARRINATLGPVTKARKGETLNADGRTETQQRFEDAWNEYLADDDGATREPPWAIGWFMSGGVKARYETRALRAQQGAA